jgi:hypothetical protein
MNLAVLVADYQTYKFEQGALNYYPPCVSCDVDSLPFAVDFVPPGDFGGITFTYTETADTLLHGTIIWLGRGALDRPDNFQPRAQFLLLESAAAGPVSAEYFNIMPVLAAAEFESRADTAWSHVERLDIVREFATLEYRAGFYLYAPAVGAFDPSEARWIIFLYRRG